MHQEVRWKPFNTAPKDRPIYAFSPSEGIHRIKWAEPEPMEAWRAKWKIRHIDESIITATSNSLEGYLYWAEIWEIEPQSETQTIKENKHEGL
jgi:hypothetical protein